MNCATIQKTLNERFDEGMELIAGFEAHVATCTECGNVLTELMGLNAALSEDLPVDVPGALTANIKAGLARERRAKYRPALIAAVGVALLTLTAAVNRFAPALTYVEEGWAWFAARFSGASWLEPGPALFAQIDAGLAAGLARLDGLTGTSPLTIWIALALTLTLVLALNGFEAARLRTAEGDHDTG